MAGTGRHVARRSLQGMTPYVLYNAIMRLSDRFMVKMLALIGFRGGEARTGQLGCEALVREQKR
jgi:hypothetical protein